MSKLLGIFLAYSILGYILEVSHSIIVKRKMENRGFLYGPYCPMYGFGGILLTYIFQNTNIITVFLGTFIITFLVEYLTSFCLEKIFGVHFWTYDDLPLNINGRVCLIYLFLFSLVGVFGIFIFNPLILKIINYLPLFLLIIFTNIVLLDFIIMSYLTKKYQNKFTKNIDNTEELNNLIKKNYWHLLFNIK